MRLVAEDVAGPAQFCNADASFWDTRVAPRDRAGQRGWSWSMAGPLHAYGCLAIIPVWGQGIRAAGSVPRLGEDSTDVRIVEERWRVSGIIAGLERIGGKNWHGRDEVVRRAWGWIEHGQEREARECDAFFGLSGTERYGVGKGVRPGRTLGQPGYIGEAIWRARGDGHGFTFRRVEGRFTGEADLGAPSNGTQVLGASLT